MYLIHFNMATKYTNEKGQLHSHDGLPAVILENGDKCWFINGRLNRPTPLGCSEALPAIERANGDKCWYVNDKLHRDDGLPAIEMANGQKWWYVNGHLHRETPLGAPSELPAIELPNGKYWYFKGELHRDGGLPAYEGADGDKEWYVNGKRHRTGGLPAVDRVNGDKLWYINGINMTSFYKKYQEVHRIRAQKRIYFWIIQRLYRPESDSAKRLAYASWLETQKLTL
jgi:hypothetical protein